LAVRSKVTSCEFEMLYPEIDSRETWNFNYLDGFITFNEWWVMRRNS
jgi:hypothetical protein